MPRWMISLLFVAVCTLWWGCGAPPNSRAQENKALALRFVEMVNRAQWDGLDQVVAPNFVRHSQATPEVDVRNRDDFKKFLMDNHVIFPDEHMEWKQVVAEGDRVAFFGSYTGTQQAPMGPFPATGKKITLDVAGVLRMENGTIAELWIVWDNMAGLAQLGHWPPPASPPN